MNRQEILEFPRESKYGVTRQLASKSYGNWQAAECNGQIGESREIYSGHHGLAHRIPRRQGAARTAMKQVTAAQISSAR
jgi:hypothetical protein